MTSQLLYLFLDHICIKIFVFLFRFSLYNRSISYTHDVMVVVFVSGAVLYFSYLEVEEDSEEDSDYTATLYNLKEYQKEERGKGRRLRMENMICQEKERAKAQQDPSIEDDESESGLSVLRADDE